MTNNILIDKFFENRGYTSEYLDEINDASYDRLKDIDILASELKDIHDNKDPIVVYPDFDMDGVAAGSCGFAGFAELGFNVKLFVPNPSEGYGISSKSIDDVIDLYPDTKVIITCDTGVGCSEAALRCKEKNVRFFVTDHHKQLVKIDAEIIVDPMRADEEYAHPFICGAFVMQQVLQRYADLYCNAFMQDQIRRLRVFAGIGTVSDTMPLLYENRQVVRDAIDICKLVYGDGTESSVSNIAGSNVYRRAFWGIYAILKTYESCGVIKSIDDINEDFFGFYLAPAVNAVKRMDGDMSKAFGLFFANNRMENMEYLYTLNNNRKLEVKNAISNLLNTDQPFAPFVYISDARPGILGLIAQQLISLSGMPTFVVSQDESGSFHGSGRSPEWYPCLTRVGDIEGVFVGGHEGAFGCGFGDMGVIARLVDFLHEDVPAIFSEVEVVEVQPDIVITTDWSSGIGIDIGLFTDYLHSIRNYAPFGKGFPAPIMKFVFNNSDVISPDGVKPGWETMGKAKQHLKIHFMNGFDVICWNQAHLISQKDSFEKHEIIGNLKFTEFRDVVSIVFDGDFVEQ